MLSLLTTIATIITMVPWSSSLSSLLSHLGRASFVLVVAADTIGCNRRDGWAQVPLNLCSSDRSNTIVVVAAVAVDDGQTYHSRFKAKYMVAEH